MNDVKEMDVEPLLATIGDHWRNQQNTIKNLGETVEILRAENKRLDNEVEKLRQNNKDFYEMVCATQEKGDKYAVALREIFFIATGRQMGSDLSKGLNHLRQTIVNMKANVFTKPNAQSKANPVPPPEEEGGVEMSAEDLLKAIFGDQVRVPEPGQGKPIVLMVRAPRA